MIRVENKELLFSREDSRIGAEGDNSTVVRSFRIPRIQNDGVDLANLTFKVDILYKDTNTSDIADLDKTVTEDNIDLDWTISSSVASHTGGIFINLRAFDAAGELKWRSYKGVVYVEDTNGVVVPSGSLSELEQLEARIDGVVASEDSRVAAENARVAAESARVSAENSRVVAENARVAAETGRVNAENARVQADARREQDLQDAIATAEQTLGAHYDQSLDNATQTLTENYEQALENASQTLIGAVEDIKDEALGYANSAASSATDSGISARHSEESAEDARLSAQNAAASEEILDFYVDYVIPRFVIANNRLYIRDTATQSFIVANNRLYIQNPA